MTRGWRGLLRKVHPEGIPWPGSVMYNRLAGTRVFQRHYELVAKDVISYCASGRILDVGTGPGWLLVKLREASPSLEPVGVDVSEAMVKKAQENMKRAGYSDVIEVRHGSAERLPFEDETFEAVVSTGTMHHWKQPVTGLNEVHRVLKPGGYGLMYDLVAKTPEGVTREARREFGRFRTTLLWLHSFEEPFLEEEEMRGLAEASRFGKCMTKYVGVLCGLIMRKETGGGS